MCARTKGRCSLLAKPIGTRTLYTVAPSSRSATPLPRVNSRLGRFVSPNSIPLKCFSHRCIIVIIFLTYGSKGYYGIKHRGKTKTTTTVPKQTIATKGVRESERNTVYTPSAFTVGIPFVPYSTQDRRPVFYGGVPVSRNNTFVPYFG